MTDLEEAIWVVLLAFLIVGYIQIHHGPQDFRNPHPVEMWSYAENNR